jgi:Dehydrogenases with different specificities (related to short-chain alcohol dehydrogenases)
MYNPFSLKEKTILVTGASSGIGREIAIECSKMGAKVIITGRDKERLINTFSELSEEGKHLFFVADLTDSKDVLALIQQLPTLDGVVHSAGVGISLPFQFCSQEKVKSVISANLESPIELLYSIIKFKKNSKLGFSVVFISSIAGTLVSYPGNSIYSASKAGITGLAKGMAIDLAHKKIRVNCILPGMIETPMVAGLSERVSQEALDEDKKRYPLARYGSPKDVAMGTVYLLSDASTWITGTNLVIDGGFTLQ